MATSFDCKTYNYFEEITDSLVTRGANHTVIELIFLAFCACILDADGWVEVERYEDAKIDWRRRTLFPLKSRIPSHDTLGRGFGRLDTVEVYTSMQSWTYEVVGCLRRHTVAIDGNDATWFL